MISTQSLQRWPARIAGMCAFTLIEVLMSVAIIGVLIAIVIPSVRGAVGQARAFKCQTALRSTAFDFTLFADDTLHPSRGNDDLPESDVGRGMFALETFIESQYGLDEFWSYGNTGLVRLPDAAGRDPMRCAEVRGPLELRRNVPCSQGAVNPPENVSFGFNIRLHQQEGRNGPVGLNERVLSGNDQVGPSAIPLALDVDGRAASAAGRVPLFTGPGLGNPRFQNFWFPAMRHAGAVNTAFLDGHVKSSRAPLEESGWAWTFQPAH